MIPNGLALALAGLSGLALGSYSVTAGLRFCRAETSSVGRSHCDTCGVSLGFAQTVPVVSYLGLRGTCAHCGDPIDPAHLVGEIGGALVLVTAFWVAPPTRAVLMAILGLALVAAATVDAKTKRLPDVFTLIAGAASIGLSLMDGAGKVEAGLIAAGIASSILMLLRWITQATRRDPGLGLGDVKLIAALALWLGPATPAMVVVAAVIGLISVPFARGTDGRLPFGPMIALAAWTVGVANEWGWRPWVL